MKNYAQNKILKNLKNHSVVVKFQRRKGYLYASRLPKNQIDRKDLISNMQDLTEDAISSHYTFMDHLINEGKS